MSDTWGRSPGLLDRVREREVLDQFVARVRASESQALVIRGDAGAGKSSLLRHLETAADGCTLLWASGVESEMELAYAGLHALCVPMLAAIDELPEPQRDALGTGWGLPPGPPPDGSLVGRGGLRRLAVNCAPAPLVCLVDDAQWLDTASIDTLAFVARRLLAERVGIMFAVRETGTGPILDGFPELLVEGLPPEDARLLLDAMIPGPLDEHVKARILDEARGNPLALIELPRGTNPAELAGGFGLPAARPLTSRIEQSFVQRIETLPRDSQLLVLAAASEPLGDVGLLWRAADHLGIDRGASRAAESAGLIELGVRVRFSHPLVRSAAHRAMDQDDHREVRRALADATDPDRDPDRRAWHRAHATAGPDEDVAAEMERSADRAQARGGLAAAAAFLQRAAELTPDQAERAERSLAAAQSKLQVADADAAVRLLAAAELGPLTDIQRARSERIRARAAFLSGRGRDAPALLLEAARRLEPLDPTLARDTYIEAFSSAMFSGRLGTGPGGPEIAVAAASLVSSPSTQPGDLLLRSLVLRFTDGYAASVDPTTDALRAILERADRVETSWLWQACRLATDVWDDDLWSELAVRSVRRARETGALALLPNALNHLAASHVHAGRLSEAAVMSDEVSLLAEATGQPYLEYSRYKLAAARGDETVVQALIDGPLQDARARGEGAAIAVELALLASMHNGAGEYGEGFAAAQQGCEAAEIIGYNTSLVELVEAGVRIGRVDEAGSAFEILVERTNAAGTPWALGVAARCAALLRDDEEDYRRSIELLSRSRAAIELGRTQLLYGEWLRRRGRRTDARGALRAAHERFGQMGAVTLAERARRELEATGETTRRITADNWQVLTPQELQVARLARDGLTNPEIGAQLYVSPRTVEYHLHKVFRKLQVSNRRELRSALDDAPTGP